MQQKASRAHTQSKQSQPVHPGMPGSATQPSCSPQGPQSASQDRQVSEPLQVPSPQAGVQGAQSAGHELQSSASALQVPSPHQAGQFSLQSCTHSSTQRASHAPWQQPGSMRHTQLRQAQSVQPGAALGKHPPPASQGPQSAGQLPHPSDSMAAQMPSPQWGGQAPHSCGQERQSSAISQIPLPHVGRQGPQSASQERQSSLAAQMLSPQRAGQMPQSAGQDSQSSASFARQSPSPQRPQGPQSAMQVAQLSESEQVPSPHSPQGPQSVSQFSQVSG